MCKCGTCGKVSSAVGPKGDTGTTGATGATGASGAVPGIIDVTTATKTLNGTTDSGSIVLLDRGAGIDLTLPTAPVNGTNYTFQAATDALGSYVISAGVGATFSGYVSAGKASTAPTIFTTTTATSVNLNGTTSGGLVGTDFYVIFLTDKWHISGPTYGSGVLITPFV